MNVFLVLISVTTIVHGRPEAGYSYNAPNRPNIIGGSGTGGGQNFGVSSQINFGGSAGGGGGGGGFTGTTGFNGGQSSGFNSGFSNSGFGSNSFSSSGGFIGGGGQQQQQQQQTIIQKHIYVHVPPPEPEEYRQQQQIQQGVAQKHYKIIFIKAPSAPQPSQAQIALAAQNQEKTIVYVLVKKPDDIQDIAVPQQAAVQPSKPEVYFIKYKTHRENGGIGGSSGIINGGTTIGSGSSSTILSSGIGSSSSSISSGTSSVNIGVTSGNGLPSAQYGPPGQSGPY